MWEKGSVRNRIAFLTAAVCAGMMMTACGKISDPQTEASTKVQESAGRVSASEGNGSTGAGTDASYEAYSGRWTLSGITGEELASDGTAMLSLRINNENELQGSLFTQQGSTERFAEISDIEGTISEGVLTYDFRDDGWGGTGSLFIEFLKDSIRVEVKDYVMNPDNSSGYGISGSYSLIREGTGDAGGKETGMDKQPESWEDMTETELLDAVYERYYAVWPGDSLEKECNSRAEYYTASAYYEEVTKYLETILEVTDTAKVIEPLYFTDRKTYTEEQYSEVPPLILSIAKNEIYARHGYIFQNEDLQNYFMGCIWYTPTCSPEEFSDTVFNEYEKANLKVLAGLEGKGF